MPRGGARAHVNIDRAVTLSRPEMLHGVTDVGLFAQIPPALFLVDGNNLLWRAAHGWPAPFVATDGRDLTPLFRFVTLLRRALGTYGLFAECVVCFDGADAWGERLDVDASYKSNRRYDDKDLSFMGWLPEIRAALDCADVVNIEAPDHEADDVIATLAARAGGRPVRILSTDRDYYQLIGEGTFVVNPRGRPALMDEDALLAQYGVTPKQWCDFRALAGDPSDGIPGLRGIGIATAASLLRDGKTLEDIGSLFGEQFDDVVRWRELIRLRTDLPLDFQPTGLPTPRLPAPSRVCEALGLV